VNLRSENRREINIYPMIVFVITFMIKYRFLASYRARSSISQSEVFPANRQRGYVDLHRARLISIPRADNARFRYARMGETGASGWIKNIKKKGKKKKERKERVSFVFQAALATATLPRWLIDRRLFIKPSICWQKQASCRSWL